MDHELEAAHERIAELELAIATHHLPAKTPRMLVAIIVASIMITVGALVAMVVLMTAKLPERTFATPTPLPAETAASLATTAFEPTFWNGPVTGAINDDGIEDFVILGDAASGIEVIAIDGATFRPIWRQGPFSLEGGRKSRHLKRAGDFVLLGDARAVLAFQLRSGAPAGNFRSATEIGELCPFESGAAKVYLGESPIGHGEILDLDAQKLEPALPEQWNKLDCHGRSDTPSCDERKPPSFPCETRRRVPSRIVTSVYATYEDETSRVSVGWTAQDGNAPYFGSFMDKKTNRITWEGRLTAPEDVSKERDFRFSYAGDKVIFVYRAPGGAIRVLARNADGIAWSFVTGSEGVSLEGIAGTATRVYLVFDTRLVVLDAKSGREHTTIGSIPAGPP
jgi:hypothetical protein